VTRLPGSYSGVIGAFQMAVQVFSSTIPMTFSF
jgi:hypothetical protein